MRKGVRLCLSCRSSRLVAQTGPVPCFCWWITSFGPRPPLWPRRRQVRPMSCAGTSRPPSRPAAPTTCCSARGPPTSRRSAPGRSPSPIEWKSKPALFRPAQARARPARTRATPPAARASLYASRSSRPRPVPALRATRRALHWLPQAVPAPVSNAARQRREAPTSADLARLVPRRHRSMPLVSAAVSADTGLCWRRARHGEPPGGFEIPPQLPK